MSNQSTDRPADSPHPEPEIIPPGALPHDRVTPRPRPNPRFADAGPRREAVFIMVDQDGRTHTARLEPPGPFAVAGAVMVLGLIAAAVLLVALGFVLFWVPVIAIVVAALAFSGYLRGAWWRLTGR